MGPFLDFKSIQFVIFMVLLWLSGFLSLKTLPRSLYLYSVVVLAAGKFS